MLQRDDAEHEPQLALQQPQQRRELGEERLDLVLVHGVLPAAGTAEKKTKKKNKQTNKEKTEHEKAVQYKSINYGRIDQVLAPLQIDYAVVWTLRLSGGRFSEGGLLKME